MKKLIPALALLLVSASLLATSSFAWFSMNDSVTATGMTVTVAAPTSLVISKAQNTGYGSTVALASTAGTGAEGTTPKFYPAAYAVTSSKLDATTPFWKLTTEAMVTVDEAGVLKALETPIANGSAATAFEEATFDHDGDEATEDNTETGETAPVAVYAASTDFLKDTVYLKVEGQNSIDVKAKAKWAANTDYPAVRQAMRILFVVDGAVVGTILMGENGGETASKIVTLAPSTTEGTSATPVAVDIYYFLDGTDSNCKNANIVKDSAISVDLEFFVPSGT